MLGDLQKGNLDLRGSDVVLKPYKEENSCDINFIIRQVFILKLLDYIGIEFFPVIQIYILIYIFIYLLYFYFLFIFIYIVKVISILSAGLLQYNIVWLSRF